MGVACLKLEGRMKRPEYVAVITSIYRRLLDEKRRPTREEQRQLELAFSRSGFTDGYYLGRKGPQMFGTGRRMSRSPRSCLPRPGHCTKRRIAGRWRWTWTASAGPVSRCA